MNNAKTYILIVVCIVIIGAIYFIESQSADKTGTTDKTVTIIPRTASVQKKSNRYALAKEITTPDGFINTDGKPITIGDLIGKKVILVDFWTYSCINCQRTTPYLNAWYEKYSASGGSASGGRDKGLVIIGVHTPEFEFEKDYDNVKTAVEKFGIHYPVVLDNDYSTWTAYKNRYWPHKYLIDIDGYIVYDHIGEGGYEETEQKIQEALTERMAVLGVGEGGAIDQSLTKEIPFGVDGGSRSPETYFGATRNEFLGNGSIGIVGNQKNLSIPERRDLDTLYLSGDWNIADEFAQNNSSNAGIVYRYAAQNVFFVAEADHETVVEVLLDGKPLRSEAGADVIKTADGKTVVNIKEARLYNIIEDNQSATHTLEFIIHDQGLKAYTFTFG